MDGALRADLLRVADPGRPYEDTRWDTRAIVLGVLDALGAWAVIEYRFRRWVRTSSTPARLLLKPVAMVSRKAVEIIAGISISTDADIGPGSSSRISAGCSSGRASWRARTSR